MTYKKRIALISLDYVVNRALTNQLEDVFCGEIEVVPILLEENNMINDDNLDLIVCSSKVILGEIKRRINGKIPIVPVKRTISIKKIAEVMNLDVGEKVLLVSNHLSTARESIEALKKLGVDHVKFIPYYPGCGSEICDIAVTPGGAHHVPKEVKKVIDLGIRIIDITTIIEIFLKLNLPIEDLRMVSARYSKDIVELTRYNSEINKVLKAMFEVTSDGMAALDVSGNIFYCNHKFASCLSMMHNQLISKNIAEIIKDKAILDIIFDSHHRNNEIIDIKDREFILHKTLLYQNNMLTGHVVGLHEVMHIQDMEKAVRKKHEDKGFVAKYTFNDLVGVSPRLHEKINIAKKAAKSDLTVLIEGDNGTGKEIFAQAIHNESNRKHGPFVAVNFASLSETLLESELFGYEEGAFTGANKGGKMGFFEQADKGTIFIDEIGDISSGIQMRLLRVLQEKQIMRVGGSKKIPVDVRIIAATNKDLLNQIDKNEFRKDLYYRLKVLHFTIPKLNERKEDIPLLAKFYLKNLGSSKYLSEQVLEAFKSYSWPGNVREFENLIYYLDTIIEHNCIEMADLPEDLKGQLIRKVDETDSHYNAIRAALLPVKRIAEYTEILGVLYSSNKQGIAMGRNSIARVLKEANIVLTPEQIRTRLKEMEKTKLVSIGNTKQGTTISEEGEKFLKVHGIEWVSD